MSRAQGLLERCSGRRPEPGIPSPSGRGAVKGGYILPGAAYSHRAARAAFPVDGTRGGGTRRPRLGSRQLGTRQQRGRAAPAGDPGLAAPLRDLPVESVRVALTGGDLTALAGHPHLASLDLNTTAPADLTPLRSVPNLHGLDLSGAETADLTVLADLANLRYLALDRQQWTTLLDHGKVPPAPAAVRLAGDDVTFDDALALASRVGLDTGDALRVAGSL
ncbi:hypothetical protein [Streptomyces sp. NPDC056817]|uniref:hypothetical protein n=1 Tax=Streptomyces sp. NPDC056817 TaxID=3345950 RepID=UPI00368D87DB